MLLTEKVKIKIINFNVNLYKNKGYSCEIGDEIDVDVWDVSKHSKAKILLLCDSCKKNTKEISITSLNSYKPYENGKYLCNYCYYNYLNSRQCDICGGTDGVSDYLSKGQLLCKKHQKQMWRHGETKRTDRDSNEIRIYEDYAEFDTYNKQGVKNGTFKIDLDMVDFIKTHKMHKHKDGYACYKLDNKDKKTKNMRLHRYIMDVADDTINNYKHVVDHINRDKSDNRRINLRIVSQETNNRNVGKYSHNTSGYKGISFNKQRQKWEVYIHQNNKKINLGLYDTIERAIQVRELAEITYFGTDSPRYKELIEKYISDTKVQDYLLKNNKEDNSCQNK